MDLAVSDSDVLIHLAKLNQLKLLKAQFSKIYISNIIYLGGNPFVNLSLTFFERHHPN